MNKTPSLKLCLSIILFLATYLSAMGEDGNTTENTPTAVAQAIEDVKSPEQAPEEEIITLDTGNTAWMITATALVLFMTLPGLALFYGGLVQSKNVLSVLMLSLIHI